MAKGGFRGGFPGGNQMNMVRQAQKMQQDFLKMQQELEAKTYTAAAVLKLVDEGKVELDAPVTAYLPDFTMADGRYTDITVRMLLNHSSGLPGSTIANGFLLNDPDTLAADTLPASWRR